MADGEEGVGREGEYASLALGDGHHCNDNSNKTDRFKKYHVNESSDLEHLVQGHTAKALNQGAL